MAASTNAARWIYGLLGVAIVAGAVAVWFNQPDDSSSVLPPASTAAAPTTRPALTLSPPRDFPAPRFSETRFLNTGPDASYVGTSACIDCHSGHYDSFLITHHSRALADLDPRAEPPDGTFVHQASGRVYRVYRKDGQMRHEELLRSDDGKEISRIDLPVRYLIGSGNFSRSYLVDVDGFLFESPITWYAAKKKWEVSPGYDLPRHWGFERHVYVTCLACHTGGVAPKDGAVHKLTIREQAIGCESCHGPGSKHVELRKGRKLAADEADQTIVNPAKLPRPLLESTCAVCHLSGAASVTLRGRKEGDYRPGLPLSDYRVDYKFDSGAEQMTVVGHMEQLRRSSCYQNSSMTCVTCHDPHARQRPADPVAFYRQKCLDCHADKGCKLSSAERLKKEPADNCAACHMPRTDTDIPHFAFRHHRIGKHGPAAPPPQREPKLLPVDDVSRLPEIDLRRNLGLAYLQASKKVEYERWAPAFRDRARELLEPVFAEGMHDGAVTTSLAEIYVRKDDRQAAILAAEALRSKEITPDQRAVSMAVLAYTAARAGDLPAAVNLLEQITRLRRGVEDLLLLGRLRLELARPREALDALHQAEAIRPDRADVQESLAEAYRLVGDPVSEGEHRARAKWLADHPLR